MWEEVTKVGRGVGTRNGDLSTVSVESEVGVGEWKTWTEAGVSDDIWKNPDKCGWTEFKQEGDPGVQPLS